MSSKNWAAGPLFTVTNAVPPTRFTGATTLVGAGIDLRNLPAGARHVVFMDAYETNVNNSGVTWSIQNSALSATSYSDATVSGSLLGTGATAGLVQRKAGVLVDPAKPYLRIRVQGDANSAVDVVANVLSFTNV